MRTRRGGSLCNALSRNNRHYIKLAHAAAITSAREFVNALLVNVTLIYQSPRGRHCAGTSRKMRKPIIIHLKAAQHEERRTYII